MISTHDDHTERTSYLDWSDEGKASVPRYVVGLVLALFVFFVLAGLGAFPVIFHDPAYKDSLVESNLATLLAFVIPFVALPLLVKLIHARPSWSLAFPVLRYEAWNLWAGFLVSTVVGLVTLFLSDTLGLIDLHWQGFNWAAWLPLAAIGTIGIFIQSTSEELLFRGYLTQFVRRLVKRPAVFLGIPAFLFTLPHVANIPAFEGNPMILAPYFASGLLFGWAAFRTGSLWMAIGLHWNNNLMGLLVVGVEGDVLRSVAPVTFPMPTLTFTTLVTVIQALACFAILAVLIRRREEGGGV